MCGIFAYVGRNNAIKKTMSGLKKLEYRGYDSAGIAGVNEGKIWHCKERGKIANLEDLIAEDHPQIGAAIAQTRWATHGKPGKINAHPHFDNAHSLAVVHNGIIENHEGLRKLLMSKGVSFVSETDTEAVAHLIASLYKGDLVKAIQESVKQLKGSFALAVIHQDHPGKVFAIAHECPLIIGIGDEEVFISSDSNAFVAHTREAIFLENKEIAVVSIDKLHIFNAMECEVIKERQTLEATAESVSRGSFEHFTLKEIHEQPQTIQNAMFSRFSNEYGTALFEELTFDENELRSVERILILACGTSWHAGCVAGYMIEDRARIPVQVEIASEFRYKNPVIPPNTLVIAISQSGETADTIAAMRELKAKGSKILAICNVQDSTIAREADSCLFLRAGPEIGVCSTKAFTSQVIVLALFGLMLARMRHMSKYDGQQFLLALKKLPKQIQSVLDQAAVIQSTAQKYATCEHFFFLGRRYMYPTALEGALKLKEISYINANGYPAGEMKHGPIALINETSPTVALCANKITYEKLLSNLMEIKARGGPIIAIAEEDNQQGLQSIADVTITVPTTIDELAVVPVSVVLQLLAYYTAKERGADIDQPRNLAKSVTVE